MAAIRNDHNYSQTAGRFAGSMDLLVGMILGFAALHPRLYAAGRFAG